MIQLAESIVHNVIREYIERNRITEIRLHNIITDILNERENGHFESIFTDIGDLYCIDTGIPEVLYNKVVEHFNTLRGNYQFTSHIKKYLYAQEVNPQPIEYVDCQTSHRFSRGGLLRALNNVKIGNSGGDDNARIFEVGTQFAEKEGLDVNPHILKYGIKCPYDSYNVISIIIYTDVKNKLCLGTAWLNPKGYEIKGIAKQNEFTHKYRTSADFKHPENITMITKQGKFTPSKPGFIGDRPNQGPKYPGFIGDRPNQGPKYPGFIGDKPNQGPMGGIPNQWSHRPGFISSSKPQSAYDDGSNYLLIRNGSNIKL